MVFVLTKDYSYSYSYGRVNPIRRESNGPSGGQIMLVPVVRSWVVPGSVPTVLVATTNTSIVQVSSKLSHSHMRGRSTAQQPGLESSGSCLWSCPLLAWLCPAPRGTAE